MWVTSAPVNWAMLEPPPEEIELVLNINKVSNRCCSLDNIHSLERRDLITAYPAARQAAIVASL